MEEYVDVNEDQSVSHIFFHASTFKLFQDGLQILKEKIIALERQMAVFKVEKSPYVKERTDIDRLIRWGEEKLKTAKFDYDDIDLDGISYKTLRYLKGAALIAADHYENQKIELVNNSSLPLRMIQAIEAKISLLKEKSRQGVLAKLKPADIYIDVMKSTINPPTSGFEIKNEEFPATEVKDKQTECTCFVIMPIGKKTTKEYEENMAVFKNIIEKAVLNSGFKIKCYHSELINDPGAIPAQIIKSLANDDIVIADLRRSNLNVIWELGVRHAFAKKSIMIYSQDTEAFFDTSSYRMARYHTDGQSNFDFFYRIRDFIQHMISNPDVPDNPVWESGIKPRTPLHEGPKVEVSYDKLTLTENRHDYSFSLGIRNTGKAALINLIVELYFPAEYLERHKWQYDHLRSEQITEKAAKYISLTFNYSALSVEAQRIFETSLLPGKTIWIFGADEQRPITKLPYFVDTNNWEHRHKYQVKWKIYIQGQLIVDGGIPFESLQMF